MCARSRSQSPNPDSAQAIGELFDTDFRNIRLMCRGMNAIEGGIERVRRWRGKPGASTTRDWLQHAQAPQTTLF